MVFRVLDRTRQVFDCVAKSLEGENVGDGVRALVGRAQDWIRGARRALVVWNSCPRFEGVTKHVEARRGVDCAGHCTSVEGIDYAECGFEIAVRDSRLCTLRHQIEDGGTGRLRPCSCCRGHGDEREELSGNG